jgi:hypothetical protein
MAPFFRRLGARFFGCLAGTAFGGSIVTFMGGSGVPEPSMRKYAPE